MLPTLKDTDWVLLDTSLKRKRNLQKDDIIAFKLSPSMRERSFYYGEAPDYMIKRVVGVAGDLIKSDDNRTVTIPYGCVYVLGDNTDLSIDSRHIGCIPVKCIKGVLVRVTAGKRSKALNVGIAASLKDAYKECLSAAYEKLGIE